MTPTIEPARRTRMPTLRRQRPSNQSNPFEKKVNTLEKTCFVCCFFIESNHCALIHSHHPQTSTCRAEDLCEPVQVGGQQWPELCVGNGWRPGTGQQSGQVRCPISHLRYVSGNSRWSTVIRYSRQCSIVSFDNDYGCIGCCCCCSTSST